MKRILRANGRKVSMRSSFVAIFAIVLVMTMLLSTTAWAATTSTFTISYDNTGKVAMKNFDSDITSYKSNGVYQSTGSGVTKSITYYVCPRQFAVVGGYKVNGLEGGVYKIVGPGTYTESITDGFVMVVDKDDIAKEWQFRLYQVYSNNWSIKYFWGTYLIP